MPLETGNPGQAEASLRQYVGKTVRLKSGSPLMTVEGVTSTPFGFALLCCWFDSPESTQLERATLQVSSIELAEKPRSIVEIF